MLVFAVKGSYSGWQLQLVGTPVYAGDDDMAKRQSILVAKYDGRSADRRKVT